MGRSWIGKGNQNHGKQPKPDPKKTHGPEETQEAQDARGHTSYELDGRRQVAHSTCYCTQYSGDHAR